MVCHQEMHAAGLLCTFVPLRTWRQHVLHLHQRASKDHARILLRCHCVSLTGALEGLSITPFPAGRLIGSSVWRVSWQGEVGTWRTRFAHQCMVVLRPVITEAELDEEEHF